MKLVAFDIYPSDSVQFVADAHRLPLPDDPRSSTVVVQAVLEHVIDPSKVVEEIHRVLVEDGVVYAETPFMQQVHEGPYDFTRFHRQWTQVPVPGIALLASGTVGRLGRSFSGRLSISFGG